MHLRLVLFSLLIASLFAGCQPSQPEPVLTPRFRVKTVTWRSNTTDNLSYQRRYDYDPAGKLTVIKVYSLDNVLWGTPQPFVYHYNNRSTYDWVELASGEGRRTLYYLDSLDRLKDIYQYEPKPFENLVKEEHLFYGSDNNPVRRVSIQGGLNMQRLYVYDDYQYKDGNIAQVSTRLSFNTGYDFGVSTTNYTYDNKPNPFYGNYLLDSYSPPSFSIHSKNNLIDSTVTRTFDTHGLITSSTDRGGATTSYTYEFY